MKTGIYGKAISEIYIDSLKETMTIKRGNNISLRTVYKIEKESMDFFKNLCLSRNKRTLWHPGWGTCRIIYYEKEEVK